MIIQAMTEILLDNHFMEDRLILGGLGRIGGITLKKNVRLAL
jgi:hypothetical protein